MDMTGIAIRRGLRLGAAVAGLAALGFAAPASAQEAPAEVAAVEIVCIDLGFDTSECTSAVSSALVTGIEGATNANLAAAGIGVVVDLDI
jgi:hypothetical protein